MRDYENMDTWKLLSILFASNCTEIDPYLAKRFNSTDDIYSYYYQFSYNYYQENMPLTVKKISNIIISSIGKEQTNYWKINYVNKWLNDDAKNALLKYWINDDYSYIPRWIYGQINSDNEIDVLEKITRIYKKGKSRYKVAYICEMFQNMNEKNISSACKILTESTSAVAACVLHRKNIPEEYIIKGLKALSKLNVSRTIMCKIDFKKLEELSPVARLKVMEHLVERYHINNLPFNKTPTKNDIERLLFPCSIKYNNRVSKLLNSVDFYINSQL